MAGSIVRMGVGYDRLDRVALAARGVTVCNVPGMYTAKRRVMAR